MRNWILAFFVFSIAGCSTDQSRYNPVDWNSQAPAMPEKPQPIPETHEVSATLQSLLKLHNEQRELKGRPGFQLDLYLCQYAQNHSDWMAKKNNMKHSDISALMGNYSRAGENIAFNQKTEAEVVNAWMNSSGHRANIMNRAFIKVGFGVAYNSNGDPYWCTCFGG